MTDISEVFPLGRYTRPTVFTAETRARAIDDIEAMPTHLRQAVDGLNDRQLDAPYRAGGWTVRQVTHHVTDAHINAYVRTRLALTEHNPTIKPFDQNQWSELTDARQQPVATSLALIDALHQRWVTLLRSLTPADFARPFVHPESGPLTVDQLVAEYAWEGQHHVAQITSLRQRAGW